MARRRRIGIGVSELRRHFGKYLQLCRQVDIVILRRGKPVAIMVSVVRFQRLAAAAARAQRRISSARKMADAARRPRKR